MINLPFCLLFPVGIFKAAFAPEDTHKICLSEPMAQIVKFPDRHFSEVKSDLEGKLLY